MTLNLHLLLRQFASGVDVHFCFVSLMPTHDNKSLVNFAKKSISGLLRSEDMGSNCRALTSSKRFHLDLTCFQKDQYFVNCEFTNS